MSFRGTLQALAKAHFPELFWRVKLSVAARELTSCGSAWSLNCLEDAALRSIIRSSLKQGGCGVDIGASIGDFTSVMAEASKADTHHAFEANPAVAEVLARRFRRKNVMVHCEALSDESGTADLHVPLTNSGAGGLRITPTVAKQGQIKEVRVPVRRLDDYLDQIDRCCIIKLDIEGAELQALRGARSLILRDKPLVYFECMSHTSVYGYGAEDVSDFFSSLGYEMRDPFSYLGALAPLSKQSFADRVANRRNYNFVAVVSKTGPLV